MCVHVILAGGVISLEDATAVFAGTLLLENNTARRGGENVTLCTYMLADKHVT